MSSISLNSNVASLNAQRRLGRSTEELRNSFERLSSGLRLNRAKDDASGLAISASLKTDARVFNQGIRNLNDAVSLLNIADGALTEMSNILVRHYELAEQAANGTLSFEQRSALNEEANALVEEYNRIAATTDFNGVQLLDGTAESIVAQAGYGDSGGVSIAVGTQLARAVGDGTFEEGASIASSTDEVRLADLNGDGFADVVHGNAGTAGNLSVRLSQGDGTFGGSIGLGAYDSPYALVDFNNDGNTDIVSHTTLGTQHYLSLRLGQGDGNFGGSSLLTGVSTPTAITTGDINNDGNQDVVIDGRAYLGNGSTGISGSSPIGGSLTNIGFISLNDFNNDGNLDVIRRGTSGTSGALEVRLGNGDGTFDASAAYTSGTTVDPAVADFNGDGNLDIIASGTSPSLVIRFGDGTGGVSSTNFVLPITTGIGSVQAADFNGDGYQDIVSGRTGADFQIQLGSGDGSFSTAVSYGSGATRIGGVADLNGDGVLDVVASDRSGFTAHLQKTNTSTAISPLELDTREGALAALSVISENLDRIQRERAAIGSSQSRLAVASNVLSSVRENVLSASSKITDADVASEAAALTRNNILVQAGAAVLAQANQSPALALQLLNAT